MSRMPSYGPESGLAWNLLAECSPVRVPSWLAPSAEPERFEVVRKRDDEPDVDASPSLTVQVPEPPAPPAPALPPPPPEPAPPPYPDLRAETALLRERLAAQVAAMAHVRRAILAASEGDLVRLAIAVAEKIIRREVSLDPSIVVGWVKEAADALVSTEGLCLAVAPDLAASIDAAAFRAAVERVATVEVDPSLAPMSCEVRTPISRAEASVEERLATVAEVLGVSRE